MSEESRRWPFSWIWPDPERENKIVYEDPVFVTATIKDAEGNLRAVRGASFTVKRTIRA
jgi:hypothetical protein